MSIFASCLVCGLLTCSPQDPATDSVQSANGGQTESSVESPLSVSQRTLIERSNRKMVAAVTEQLKSSPDSIILLSRRADALFKLGEFPRAVADYDRMVELDPSSDASHWRRGIAYFYAKQFEKAAGQFERYHSFDNVDRENGIWRYLSQHKAYGQKKARAGLLKYRKDDREPFPAVYKLFAGEITPEQILSQIDSATIDPDEREKRLFYANLYIGLNEAVEGRTENAQRHLTKSTASKWPIDAGFGPEYMWHVGRVHLRQLTKQVENSDDSNETGKQ